MKRHNTSFLQLQLGQEVIYLLLAIFALISFVLGMLTLQLGKDLKEKELELEVASRRYDELFRLFRVASDPASAELSTARGEIAKMRDQIGRLVRDLGSAQAEAAGLRESLGKIPYASTVEDLRRLQVEYERLRAENERLKAENERVIAENERLKAEVEKRTDQPPIINLDETQGYWFASGDSQLSEEFRLRLSEVVTKRLLADGERYQANVIEVVGHTDDRKVPGGNSNLDMLLIPFLNGDRRDARLQAADNTGLGMARAAAVARFLKGDKRLDDYTIVPLSAGQVVDSQGRLATSQAEQDVRERRRIEVRLRRAGPQTPQ